MKSATELRALEDRADALAAAARALRLKAIGEETAQQTADPSDDAVAEEKLQAAAADLGALIATWVPASVAQMPARTAAEQQDFAIAPAALAGVWRNRGHQDLFRRIVAALGRVSRAPA
jgi:hypothetical protein